MSDIEITPEARLCVAAGFAFAGPAGNNEAAWRSKFNEGVLRAAAAMNGRPAVMATEMLEAAVFTGEYGGYEYEESSTRLIVKVRSERGREKSKDAEGFERLRSDRTDGALGKLMKRRLDQLPIGSKILVWKILETFQSADGDDAKARVFRHFEFLAPPADGQPQPSQSQPPSSQRTAPPQRASAPAEPSEDDRQSSEGTVLSPIAEAFNRMNNNQRVDVARKSRAAGVENFMQPGTDEALVLSIIEEVLG